MCGRDSNYVGYEPEELLVGKSAHSEAIAAGAYNMFSGYMDDPHAPVYYNGMYHLFFQQHRWAPAGGTSPGAIWSARTWYPGGR